MENVYPKISVVIPVKNEANKIEDCLNGINRQTIPVNEIIIIDSGSTDGTQDKIKKYKGVRLIEIDPKDFNHGETRNLGVSLATGEYVLLTVGDSRAYNEFWIEELLKGFTDSNVAGVCGQQVVPHELANNPVEWYRPYSKPEIIRYEFKDVNSFNILTPENKKTICGWDDVTAMYKREYLTKIPFQKTSYSEDSIWAHSAILAGYAIVYNYNAKVFHYHFEDTDFTFKRSFTTMYFRYRTFGFIYPEPTISLKNKLSWLKSILKATGFNINLIIYWMKYNMTAYNAYVKAYKLFKESLEIGEEELDNRHQILCGRPPIPTKRNTNA